jgi:Protein of unknown function (DUF3489)
VKIFAINTDNNITAYASTRQARQIPQAEVFTTGKTFAALAAGWPASRLVEIWNGLAGVTPVKKFKDRTTAVTRIWSAIQSLPAATEQKAHKRKAGSSDSIGKPRDGSKKAQVLAMLRTQDGATIDDLMSATGWQKHSVRGFLATLNKKGTKVESFKNESGVRTYKAA